MKKLVINKNEIGVFIFFFLISFSKGIGLNNSNKMYLVVYLIGIILATIKLWNIGLNKKEIFLLGSIIIIGILDYVFGKETTILFTGITLIFLKKIDLKRVIKSMFYGRIIGFISMLILPVIDVLDMNIIEFYRSGEYINRYAFGYTHPNLAHSTFNIIIIMWMYLFYERINLANICLIELLNYILYKFTYSRTGFVILTTFLMIAFILKNSTKLKKILPKCLNFIFLTLIIISFIFAIGYDKIEVINKIDVLLTGRIKYTSILINNYFPPIVKNQVYTNILFDNGYFDLVYNGGLIATIWFIFMQIKTNKIIAKNNLYKEALLIFIFLIYSITESYYISSVMNIGILFIAYAIYGYFPNSYEKNNSGNIPKERYLK